MAKDASSKVLSRKISERERFLKESIPFIEKLVREKGVLIKRTTGSSNIRVVMELKNFGNFSFHCDWGQTMFGGNTIQAWYQPNTSPAENCPSATHVLSVYYQCASFTPQDCDVSVFGEGLTWQEALGRTIRDREKILAAMAKERQEAKENSLRKARQEQESLALRKKASKLGF